jgi:hypothetical protein
MQFHILMFRFLVEDGDTEDITKLCKQQAEVIQNDDNGNVRNIGQGEARHRKYKRLKHGGGHVYDRSGV